MRKSVFLFLIIIFFFSCGTLSLEERSQKAKDEYETKQRSKYIVEVRKHPDYNFERTNPRDLIVYDGFKPKKDYLIIGRIVIKQLPDANVDFIRKEIEDKVTIIGGNAILITEKKSEKSIDSDTVGFFMPQSLITYFQVTSEKEKISSISYHGYVIRWINSYFKTILAGL